MQQHLATGETCFDNQIYADDETKRRRRGVGSPTEHGQASREDKKSKIQSKSLIPHNSLWDAPSAAGQKEIKKDVQSVKVMKTSIKVASYWCYGCVLDGRHVIKNPHLDIGCLPKVVVTAAKN